MMGSVGKAFKGLKSIGVDFSDPITALGVGVPTGLFLGGIGQQLVGSVKESLVGTDKMLDQQIRNQRLEAARAMKARRLQEAMSQNMMRLAAANPQLYNQLLVGRTLPQGAVVIGGGQSSDFLDSVAYQMATGAFGNPQGTPDSSGTIDALVNSF
jgi:hypothetical protein